MQKLTEQQYNNLLKAIELAEGPGTFLYIADDDTPMCVIGQLAKIEGDDYLALKDFLRNKKACLVKLSEYDWDFLYELQTMWDRASKENEHIIKHNMKKFVEEYKNV